MSTLVHQVKTLAECALSLIHVPLGELSPFCCAFNVPLLPLLPLANRKGSKGTLKAHQNGLKSLKGTWNSCKAHSPDILSP